MHREPMQRDRPGRAGAAAPLIRQTMDLTTAIIILAVVIGLPGLATALHLGLLALASLFYRGPRTADAPPVRFLVLIPAHDEERVIGDCLAAIAADRRPGDRVVVVADRCEDATAQIARAAGADVLER